MNIHLTRFQQLLQISSRSAKHKPHINPRFRAYGKARIDIIQRIQNQQDWDKLWKSAANPFPFIWSGGWTHCTEYCVDEYAAEVGFYIDFLGFAVDEFGPEYARFSSPWGDFYIGVVAANKEKNSTPAGAFRLQFQVSDLVETCDELRRRGIQFVQPPKADRREPSRATAVLYTPHGIAIDLVGTVDFQDLELPSTSTPGLEEGMEEQAEARELTDFEEDSDPGNLWSR